MLSTLSRFQQPNVVEKSSQRFFTHSKIHFQPFFYQKTIHICLRKPKKNPIILKWNYPYRMKFIDSKSTILNDQNRCQPIFSYNPITILFHLKQMTEKQMMMFWVKSELLKNQKGWRWVIEK